MMDYKYRGGVWPNEIHTVKWILILSILLIFFIWQLFILVPIICQALFLGLEV